MHNVIILNGPNLNMLGQREPDIYGKGTLKDIETLCKKWADYIHISIDFRQTNSEGELVGWVQEADTTGYGLVINPGAYGHTSIALLDAVLSITIPVIEIHMSNIHKREDFRHNTFLSRGVRGVICGFGSQSYILALQAMSEILKKNAAT